MEGLPGRFPTYNARLLDPIRRNHLHFPSLNPQMTDNVLNEPNLLSSLAAASTQFLALSHPTNAPTSRVVFLGPGEFFSSRPHLQQGGLVASASASSSMPHRSGLLPFSNSNTSLSMTNNNKLMSRLATVQKGFLHHHHQQQQHEQSLQRRLGDQGSSSNMISATTTTTTTTTTTLENPSFFPGGEKNTSSPIILPQHRNWAELGGPGSFPMILHRAIAEMELGVIINGGGKNIASFLPDGRSFYIKNQDLFAQEVLPVFFPKMKSFSSFQRQLNLYDFRRVMGGAYRHELFVRDNPAKSSRMRRTKIKGRTPKYARKGTVLPTSDSVGETSCEQAGV